MPKTWNEPASRGAWHRLRYMSHGALWHKMFGSAVKGGRSGDPQIIPRVEYLLARNFILRVRSHPAMEHPQAAAIGAFMLCRRFPDSGA